MPVASSQHLYNVLLTEDDPRLDTPSKILTPLKPHQLTGLHKAVQLETSGRVNYKLDNPEDYVRLRPYTNQNLLRGKIDIKTNIGIIGDIVGYGKTLMALSIIAENPVSNIVRETSVVKSVNAHNFAVLTASMTRVVVDDDYIHTTLVVVPRGPVYCQWDAAIKNQTNLRLLALDSLTTIRRIMPPPATTSAHALKTFLEAYDVVLIKNTTFPTLMKHYANIPDAFSAWDRVMIDEAHDIINKTPLVHFVFLWLISATYPMLSLSGYGCRTNMVYGVRDVFIDEYMNLILVKSTREFVESSFFVQPPIEHSYLCAFNRRLAAVHPFLSKSVQERLNANDISGAIVELGGSSTTEEDIVVLVTKEIKRDIHNKEIEMNMLSNMQLSDEIRVSRTAALAVDLVRLKDKLNNIVDRVTMLEQKTCPICLDNYTNPIMLNCTHVFCGGCLINCIRTQPTQGCPSCRAKIDMSHLHAIVGTMDDVRASASTSSGTGKTIDRMMTKEEKVIEIISSKADGRFLIFSRIDASFHKIMRTLEAQGIPYVEMKGSTSHMMRALDNFRTGQVRVVLLSTYYAGSGIDISCATDVILLHTMTNERDQAEVVHNARDGLNNSTSTICCTPTKHPMQQ